LDVKLTPDIYLKDFKILRLQLEVDAEIDADLYIKCYVLMSSLNRLKRKLQNEIMLISYELF
jgi:hypothetical protein